MCVLYMQQNLRYETWLIHSRLPFVWHVIKMGSELTSEAGEEEKRERRKSKVLSSPFISFTGCEQKEWKRFIHNFLSVHCFSLFPDTVCYIFVVKRFFTSQTLFSKSMEIQMKCRRFLWWKSIGCWKGCDISCLSSHCFFFIFITVFFSNTVTEWMSLLFFSPCFILWLTPCSSFSSKLKTSNREKNQMIEGRERNEQESM